MNEYKFRAWDKKRKTMNYQKADHPTFGNHCFDFGDLFYYAKNDFIAMLYTGQKDKNGKEIYEGDRVKYRCNSLLRFVAWHNEYSRFVLAYRPDLADSDDLKEFSLKLWSVEVIGNIYEDESICDTAPYPECNGANGCDNCEHQPED